MCDTRDHMLHPVVGDHYSNHDGFDVYVKEVTYDFKMKTLVIKVLEVAKYDWIPQYTRTFFSVDEFVGFYKTDSKFLVEWCNGRE